MRREGKKHGRWLEIGTARLDSDGVIRVFLDRTPIGGFSGYAYLSPNGTKPPNPQPEWPAPPSNEEEDFDVPALLRGRQPEQGG